MLENKKIAQQNTDFIMLTNIKKKNTMSREGFMRQGGKKEGKRKEEKKEWRKKWWWGRVGANNWRKEKRYFDFFNVLVGANSKFGGININSLPYIYGARSSLNMNPHSIMSAIGSFTFHGASCTSFFPNVLSCITFWNTLSFWLLE